jgi:undecaprenyl-diphosphatase
MTWYFALLLGIVQGITEFLPISSSGHLFLIEHAFRLEIAENPFFDVVLHSGTLFAILIYFRKDWLALIKDAFRSIKTPSLLKKSELGLLIAGTLPLVFLGFPMKEIYPYFRNVYGVSFFLLAVGIIFLVVSRRKQAESTMSRKNAVIIGLAQVCAILPGISRSGLTIATGMYRGVRKDVVARFTFLLAFPAIAAATLVSMLEVSPEYVSSIGATNITIGFLSSLVASLACIAFFMNFIRKFSLTIFGYYLILVSIVIIIVSLW